MVARSSRRSSRRNPSPTSDHRVARATIETPAHARTVGLLEGVLFQRPRPFRTEHDWTIDVRDAAGMIVAKFQIVDEANELIRIAEAVDKRVEASSGELEAFLAAAEREGKPQ
jgi:hypothetical protein